jgi:hypothetical protein
LFVCLGKSKLKKQFGEMLDRIKGEALVLGDSFGF